MPRSELYNIQWCTVKCNSKYLMSTLEFANELHMVWKPENMLTVEKESAPLRHVKR